MKWIIAIVLVVAIPAAAVAATRCRDAKTGEFVSHSYAKKYPGLTTCEKAK